MTTQKNIADQFQAVNKARRERGQSELTESGFMFLAQQYPEGADLVAEDLADYEAYNIERARWDNEFHAEYAETHPEFQ